MKKFCLLFLCCFLFAVHTGNAQDYKATAEVLEMQLQILQLQSTIDAMNGGSGISATPAPINNYSNTYPSAPITNSNFPYQAYPPVPAGPPPTWNIPYNRYKTEIRVGDAGQYATISEAVKHIPNNAGEVTIILVSDTEEPQSGISIPIDKKITSFRITSNNNYRRTVWPKDRSVWFFCNGIPLVVDAAVAFGKPSMIMGGLVTYQGHNVEVTKSTIVINGEAYWVYAGGQSDRDGHTSTVDDALVIINGKVDRVYAGGRSILGETVVHNSTVVVNGTANEIYCAGYTENASAKATVGQANMKIYGWYSKFGLGLGAGQNYLLNPAGCYQ